MVALSCHFTEGPGKESELVKIIEHVLYAGDGYTCPVPWQMCAFG